METPRTSTTARPWRLSRQDLLRLELGRLGRNNALATIGALAALFVAMDVLLADFILDPVTGTIYRPLVVVLAVNIAVQAAVLSIFLVVLMHPSAKAARFIERVWRNRQSAKPMSPGMLVIARWAPVVLIALVFAFEMFIEVDFNGVKPPVTPLLALGSGLIVLGFFGRTGRLIFCGRCGYPRTRSTNCPECGRAAIDSRDWRMGTVTRSLTKVIVGVVSVAAAFVLWRF